ncbi:phosphotransferase family protein [bacterium]|nr:phosphotransferase family protein [bacterium]
MEQEVLAQVRRIEKARGLDLTPLSLERLGGLTNRNFRLESPSGSFVLRLAGTGTGAYIDRAAEEVNARAASQAGVNAEILFFDARDGTMLSRYLHNSRTMSMEAFRDLTAVKRAGVALRRLHVCGHPFQGRFDLFEQVDRYLAVLATKGATLPNGYSAVQGKAKAVRQALTRHRLPLAPCHCDPLVENFLDTGDSMRIIDFEYSGNNDPMWDLGDLSVEGGFCQEQDDELLVGYFGAEPHPLDRARMTMYKAMCDLLWTLWGVVQHADGNPAEDFWAYAVGRQERCRELMESAEFAGQLAVLQGDP